MYMYLEITKKWPCSRKITVHRPLIHGACQYPKPYSLNPKIRQVSRRSLRKGLGKIVSF